MPERVDVQLKAGTYLLVAGRFEDASARAVHVLKAERVTDRLSSFEQMRLRR